HWDANTEPDLAGYRIVWRETTAPLWQNHKDVGLVTHATLPVSKDNVIFGVQAIDKDGNVSVASYPRPTRPAQPPGTTPAGSDQPASGPSAPGQPAAPAQPSGSAKPSTPPPAAKAPAPTKTPSPTKP